MIDEAVVIVGAGPVGLTAALALARYGVPSTVVESQSRHVCVGSRSICAQKHTLELAELIGAGRAMAEEGVTWATARTYFRGHELFSVRMGEPAPDRFPPMVNIPQWRVEEILLAAASRNPLVTLAWDHTVTGLTQDDGRVAVTARDSGGSIVELHGSYVIGCDGGRSAVRELAGIGFPGYAPDDKFLIADIRAELPFPNERRFFFDPPWNPGRQVLVHQQPDQVWRIDWQVPSDTDAEEERRTGRLDERIRRIVGDAPYELVWLSEYRIAQRLADRFRAGRVFLAGDAAHVMSVFGARGMNSGMQDAVNLAWKLWLVLAGYAPEALLDTYQAERRPAAEENLRITEETMRFLVPADRRGRLRRRMVLRLALRVPHMRRYVNSGTLSQPSVYRDSPIVLAGQSGTVPSGPAPGAVLGAAPGAVAPDAAARGPGNPRVRVLDLVGRHFLALYLAPHATDARRFTTDATRPTVPTRIVTVIPYGEPGKDRLVDNQGEFASAYGSLSGRLYLIRPDTHIAAHLTDTQPGRLGDLVAHAVAAPDPRPAEPAQDV